MMQATHLEHGVHRAEAARLDRSWFWTVHLE
jgi:hypothetical protein